MVAGVDKIVHTFSNSISLKVNVITRLEFDLVYQDDTVQHVNNYTSSNNSYTSYIQGA